MSWIKGYLWIHYMLFTFSDKDELHMQLSGSVMAVKIVCCPSAYSLWLVRYAFCVTSQVMLGSQCLSIFANNDPPVTHTHTHIFNMMELRHRIAHKFLSKHLFSSWEFQDDTFCLCGIDKLFFPDVSYLMVLENLTFYFRSGLRRHWIWTQ